MSSGTLSGATWPFLSDPDRVIQQDLDIKEFTDEPHDPMIPHTFVLEPGLKIFKVYNGYWYWGRPTMAELHVDLRAVFQKIRPDFDLAAPGIEGGMGARRSRPVPRRHARGADPIHRRQEHRHQTLTPAGRGGPSLRVRDPTSGVPGLARLNARVRPTDPCVAASEARRWGDVERRARVAPGCTSGDPARQCEREPTGGGRDEHR